MGVCRCAVGAALVFGALMRSRRVASFWCVPPLYVLVAVVLTSGEWVTCVELFRVAMPFRGCSSWPGPCNMSTAWPLWVSFKLPKSRNPQCIGSRMNFPAVSFWDVYEKWPVIPGKRMCKNEWQLIQNSVTAGCLDSHDVRTIIAKCSVGIRAARLILVEKESHLPSTPFHLSGNNTKESCRAHSFWAQSFCYYAPRQTQYDEERYKLVQLLSLPKPTNWGPLHVFDLYLDGCQLNWIHVLVGWTNTEECILRKWHHILCRYESESWKKMYLSILIVITLWLSN